MLGRDWQEIEAQAAALRKALEDLLAVDNIPTGEYDGDLMGVKDNAREALASSDAGRELLERVRKLEDENRHLRAALNRIAAMEPAEVAPFFDHMTSESCYTCEEMIDMARLALLALKESGRS